ncbi:hypothetical protein KC332_g12 [Hortaea werneckii]|nr:hypothetical protein KC348_g17 [Hortaea werneckii]KAI7421943.1 hypothetical protein KC332_g12 [Hortaea werneckii]
MHHRPKGCGFSAWVKVDLQEQLPLHPDLLRHAHQHLWVMPQYALYLNQVPIRQWWSGQGDSFWSAISIDTSTVSFEPRLFITSLL